MKLLYRQFLELIYPRICVNCGDGLFAIEEHLCLKCSMDLPIVPCFNGRNVYVERLLGGRVHLANSYAYMYYGRDTISGKVLKEIKYAGNRKLGVELGRAFGRLLAPDLAIRNVDFILPVPLHPNKLKKRGFNQCDLLANGLSLETSIPVLNKALVRVNNNASQVKKNRIQRLQGSSSLFSLSDSLCLKGKHVLVVDDVITTGATLVAIFAALKGQDDIIVSFATICCPYD